MLLRFGVMATTQGSVMPNIRQTLFLVLAVAVAVSAINFTLLGMTLRTSDSLEKALLKLSPLLNFNCK